MPFQTKLACNVWVPPGLTTPDLENLYISASGTLAAAYSFVHNHSGLCHIAAQLLQFVLCVTGLESYWEASSIAAYNSLSSRLIYWNLCYSNPEKLLTGKYFLLSIRRLK